MFIHEFLKEDQEPIDEPGNTTGGMGAYYDPKEDQTALKVNDTRKTRLTLQHINKLRTMNELRAVEAKKKVERVQKQYGVKPEQEGAPI